MDRETRVPLRGAAVMISWREGGRDRHVTAHTDSTAGRARFCLPGGDVQIRAVYRNAQSQSFQLALVPGTVAHTAALEAPAVYARGQVLDHATEAPVPNAAVRLSHTDLVVMTQPDGRFVFPRVPFGDYELRVEHPSYATNRTPLQAGQHDLQAVIRVTPEAIPLTPVIVTTFSRRLDHVGFYDRERRGTGSFISRQNIEAARVQFSSDLLRKVPGVRVVLMPARRDSPRTFTMGRGTCRFRYVLDGTRTLSDFEIDMIAPMHIEGIEVYTGLGQVPAEFRAVTFDAIAPTCGVIAVWTKTGR